MNTKRLAVAAGAAALVCASAQAQDAGLTMGTGKSSVTLYGLIEPTISYVDHATAGGARLVSYQTPWFSGSRLGVTGKRDLGEAGLQAIFRLEAEFVPQNGAQDTAGVLFNRDAWAGVQSETLGKLSFGRQNAVGRDISAIYGDPYGSSSVTTEEGGYSNTNNFKALVFYGGSATGTRYDNGVVWKKAFDNGLVAAAGFQFGGVAGDFSRGQTKTLGLGYNVAPFHVAGFATDANVNTRTHRSYSLGGDYDAGMLRVGAGLFHYTAEQAAAIGSRSDNAFTVHTKFSPGGKMDYVIGYVNIKANNAAVNGGGNVLNPFANAGAATASATGSRSTVYASAMYHFDKSTDVYIAGDHLNLKDGYRIAATNGFSSQTELAVGLRLKF
jgi:predicted porin